MPFPVRAPLSLVLCLMILLCWSAQSLPAQARNSPQGPILGQAPSNCPTAPAPQHFDPHTFGPGVGGPFAWAIIGGGAAVIPSESHSAAGLRHTGYGWPQKILWAIPPSTTHKVTLHGWNLATGQRVLFNFKGVADDYTPLEIKKTGTLDPRYGGTGMDGWGGFPSEEYFPSAGCYILFAQDQTASWIVPFAFGR